MKEHKKEDMKVVTKTKTGPMMDEVNSPRNSPLKDRMMADMNEDMNEGKEV